MATSTTPVTYVEGFRPGYLGRIVQMHGEYYAKVWGSGPDFEAQTARELCDFYEAFEPSRDLIVTAHVEDVLVGSAVIIGAPTEYPGARFRWFFMEEAYRGHGIGRTLLSRTLEFCREHGYKTVYLWTVEGLPQSRHLYESIGFRVVERFQDDRYTVAHTHLRMEMSLL